MGAKISADFEISKFPPQIMLETINYYPKIESSITVNMLLSAEKVAVSEDTVICPLFTNNNTNLYSDQLYNFFYDVIGYGNYTGMKVKTE
mgnify:CR=1 FL=1